MNQSKRSFLTIKNLPPLSWSFLIIITSASILIFSRLGRDYLRDYDECIYAQYAKEMQLSRHFLTYRWNGERIFEKPPLFGWFMQLPYIFGVNEFTARISSVILGIILLIFIYFFTKKYFSDIIALAAVLVLLGSKFFFQNLITVNTDIGFTLFTFLGFYSFIISKKRKKFSYISGLFFGLAAMTKGLNVILFLCAILFTFVFNRNKEIIKNYLNLVVAFLIIITPWHLYQIVFHGKEFVQVYFVDNLLIRTIYSIFPKESIFFYGDILINDLLPWNLFVILIIIIFSFHFIKKRTLINFSSCKPDDFKIILLYVLSFVLIPLILLSLVKTRLDLYLSPLYPYIAILIAYSIGLTFKLFKKEKLVYLIILLLIVNSFVTIINETDFFRGERKVSLSNEIFLVIKNYNVDRIEYLVESYYRSLWRNPPVVKYIPAQFAYGQKPCVLFYSEKRVNLYYYENEFQNRVNIKKKGLFLINKSDDWVVKNLPIKLLYQNDAYLLFEN